MSREVRLKGYTQFLKACDLAGKETKKEVRSTLRKVGEPVKTEWSARNERFGRKTAKGIRTYVRRRGVSVEQIRPRAKELEHRRPKFTVKQQRIGNTVLASNEANIGREMENAIDRVADHFER